jgi:hypothetical protein
MIDALMNQEEAHGDQMKCLVLCLDGTWNTPESAEITNIVRIRDLIDPKFRNSKGEIITQRVYYESGVGTEGTKRTRLIQGATGAGLEDNLRGAYRFLSSIYRPSLDIYIFGFSRGAFTARSLAGFIGASGLLKPEHCTEENERRAWIYYRTVPKFRFPSDRCAFDEISFRNVRIKVLGVFDTVGSRGIPITGVLNWYNEKHYGFHDVTLGSNVDHAFHALAIDEKRVSFPASIWQYPNHKDNQTVEQVWFAGNHANIGGGYSNTSLSDIALHWMLSRIESKGLGLQFVPDWDRRIFPDALGPVYDETKKLLYASGRFYPTIRTINQCRASVAGRKAGLPPHAIPIGEMLHWTALHRRDDANSHYSPANLEVAIAAIEAGTHLMPIVGKSSRPLYWFNDKDDRDELFPELSARLRDRFARVAANLRDADVPLSTREEAKLQANKDVP